MSLQVSNAFKVAFANFFKEQFDGGEFRIFTGAAPAYSDLAETGTLLGKIRREDSGPIDFTVSGPYVIKGITDSWILTVTTTGTAGYFRYVANPADGGGASSSLLRFDGAVSATDPSAEMQIATLALVIGHTHAIDQFIYTIPPITGV